MNLDLILGNILSPPVLFFFLGLIAVWVKSDLSIPEPLPKFFSLYLLIDIGLHGGHELSSSGFSWEMIKVLGACLVLALAVPVYAFFILKKKFSTADAASIAATFGSISAVTFITGVAFLDDQGVGYDGYMVAAMALMESPAIVIGVVLFSLFKNMGDTSFRSIAETGRKIDWGHLGHEAFFNGSILLLIGAMIIGVLGGDKGWHDMEPFDAIFKGMLSFYLLDNGMLAARRLKSLRQGAKFLVPFSILMPLFNAGLAIVIARYVLHIDEGNALLLTLLAASASYIAVPAAMRLAIPKSNPAFTIPVALGIVFPFNVIVGIPLYYWIINQIW